MSGIAWTRVRGRGAISVLVFLLLASAVLRVFGSATAVTAETSLEPEGTTSTSTVSETASQIDEGELESMLESFSRREAELAEQELLIAKRMKALSIADAKVNEKLNQLAAAEESLKSTLAQASSAAEEDIGKLVGVYEKMKPAAAAALFQEMDPELSAGFIGRMNSDAAAVILAGMTPASAYAITAILAGRNANISKQ